MSQQVKVLIVDDSRIFRSAVEQSLEGVGDVRVIGSVRNGVKAIEFIRAQRPDVVTLDVDMPDMDGLETLRAIQAINAEDAALPPIGAIMISALTHKGADTTIEALELGAFDFIAKRQEATLEESMEVMKRQLLTKIRSLGSKRLVSEYPALPFDPPPVANEPLSSRIKAIVIGTSTGGPRALVDMLPDLCRMTDVPVFIVQHMPSTFTGSLAESLDSRCSASVVEARNQEVVRRGFVYIAPGGRHLLLRREGAEVLTLLNDQPAECGCRPSVDVLFRSGASVFGANVIAVVLTGMGNDGTRGIGALKRAGAHVIAQDEDTSVVWGMPGNAVASGNVDQVLPLMGIPEAAAAIAHQPASLE